MGADRSYAYLSFSSPPSPRVTILPGETLWPCLRPALSCTAKNFLSWKTSSMQAGEDSPHPLISCDCILVSYERMSGTRYHTLWWFTKSTRPIRLFAENHDGRAHTTWKVESYPINLDMTGTTESKRLWMGLSDIKFDHLLAGVVGGVASTATLHPFDLVKIRLQGESTVTCECDWQWLTWLTDYWQWLTWLLTLTWADYSLYSLHRTITLHLQYSY